jgi:hypothetical protein
MGRREGGKMGRREGGKMGRREAEIGRLVLSAAKEPSTKLACRV